MARQNKGATKAPEETQENSAEEATAPEASTESSTDEAGTSAPAEVKSDKPDLTPQLDAFKRQLGEVAGYAQEDGTFSDGTRLERGELTDEDTALIVSAYSELRSDRKMANAAKASVMEGLTAAVRIGNVDVARAYMSVLAELEKIAAPRNQAPAKPVDPTELFVERYTAVQLALQVLFNTAPDGVAEDWNERSDKMQDNLQDDLTTYLGWLGTAADERGDEPTVSPVVKAAMKIAQGKAAPKSKGGRSTSTSVASTFTGERGDILDHIQHAFQVGGGLIGEEEGSPVPVGGRLTVAQIQKIESKTYAGRDPSAGALSSRLFKGKWDESATGIRPDQSVSPAGAIRVK